MPQETVESGRSGILAPTRVETVERGGVTESVLKTDARIDWVDTARALGIMAVVCGHVPTLGSMVLRDFIYLWHMPLFFILSGFFQKNSSSDGGFIQYCSMKFRRRIIPYLGYGALALGIWYGISEPCGDKLNGIDFRENLLGYLRGEPYVNIPLWFYGCLFFSELLVYPLLRLSTKKALIIGLVWMLAMANPWLSPEKHPGFWKFGVAVVAVPFLILGFHGRNYLTRLVTTRRLYPYLVPVVIFLMLYFMHSVDMRGAIYGNLLVFYLTGFAGSLLVFCLAGYLQHIRWLKLIGKASAFIFPLHFVLMPLLTAVLVLVFKMPVRPSFASVAVGVFYLLSNLSVLTGIWLWINRAKAQKS